ncbi:ANTAR domain-containing protein [Mycolicibacterium hodleri]|uniref:ANTAR domain-containing protein n=1 Tax=Mycolicibacterium hodleri TaxID=49897 RepID=UPI001F431435|nr:ANTAR domain-containing protein [Mycolicibacterium hodleri]
MATTRQEDAITAGVAEVVDRRAVIEQAKGMLMAVYGIDADAAFELLRWQSQHHNVKLRLIAERITHAFPRASQQPTQSNRRTFDELLLTASARVTNAPRRGRGDHPCG